jgi:hypothetical protein
VKGLTEGRIVHYVLPDGRHPGECRAAVVVRAWDRDASGGNGCSNLTVLTDGSNDFGQAADDPAPPIARRTSIVFDAERKPGTWHWPQDCVA